MKRWPSPAKLNLFLYITGQREDKYHDLQTLFQFLDCCDYLTFLPRTDDVINMVTPLCQVPYDDNLIIKAAKLLIEHAKQNNLVINSPFGMDIIVDKVLPIGSGLGGGSSNAATTLVALNKLWHLNLSTNTLMQLGKQVGADVPVFIFGHSAFAEGIGEELYKITIPEKWFLLVKPDIQMSTARIFNHPELKRDSVTKNILDLLNQPFKNDCESIVRKLYPQIDHLIALLSDKAPTRLTGTGSCVFCECETKEQAQELQVFLHGNIPASTNTKSFIAKGLNHSPLFG